jgi:glutamate racemase
VGSGSYQRGVTAAVWAATADGAALPEIDLTCAACPGFVEFVERGVTSGDEITVLAERLLAPVVEAKVDTLLLGCTHYPYLARVIGDVMGREVVLVSSADETAFELSQLLADHGLARSATAPPGTHRFVSSGDVDWFRALGRRLLGPELASVEHVVFD